MLQFVRVTFAGSRNVYVDGNHNGQTNQLIRVDEGTHAFDLGEPKDYTPEKIETLVTGTTAIKPLELHFATKPAGE